MGWLWIAVGLAAAVAVAWLALAATSRRIPGGRLSRLLHVGRLGARLSASRAGAALRRAFASRERRQRIDEERRRAAAEEVARTMGQMKGVFMKLGQMLSFVSDDIPPEMRAALESLQAQAPAMDFGLIRDVAERELGMPLERAFARFESRPIAAASVGQVHRATLPSGEEVVVKIQYPGVADAIRADLENVAVLYRFVGLAYPELDPGPVVAELRGRILEELDYASEARNQEAFAAMYEGHPFIRVPRVIASRSTARVLTTELAWGRPFADVLARDEAERSRIGEIIYRFVFGSIHRSAMFNGDPHPGNYLFEPGGRVVFLDFGCVKRFPDPMLQTWRTLVRAHLGGDRAAFRDNLVALGFIRPDSPFEPDRLYEYFAFFYEPFRLDRTFTFTRAYNAASLRMVFSPEGAFQGMTKKMNMPPDFVFVNRIQWGVYSILSRLGATANFHRIHREFLFGDPPATELGRLDAEYRQKKTQLQEAS